MKELSISNVDTAGHLDPGQLSDGANDARGQF
jgi:hypothetical protein